MQTACKITFLSLKTPLLYLQYLQILNSFFYIGIQSLWLIRAVSSPQSGPEDQQYKHPPADRLTEVTNCRVILGKCIRPAITQHSPEHWAVCACNQVTTHLFGTMVPGLSLLPPAPLSWKLHYNKSQWQLWSVFNYVLLQFYVSFLDFPSFHIINLKNKKGRFANIYKSNLMGFWLESYWI